MENGFNEFQDDSEDSKLEEYSQYDNSLRIGVTLLVILAVIPYLPIFLIFQRPISIVGIILTAFGGLNGGYVAGFRTRQVQYALTVGLKVGIIGGIIAGTLQSLIESPYYLSLALPFEEILFLGLSNIVIGLLVAGVTTTLTCSYTANFRRVK